MSKTESMSEVQIVRASLEHDARRAEQMLEEMNESGIENLGRMIAWAEGNVVEEFVGNWASQIIRFADRTPEEQAEVENIETPDGPEERLLYALSEELDRKRNSLLNNWLAGRSTSSFSNAVERAEAQAAARFVGAYDRWLRRLSGEGENG